MANNNNPIKYSDLVKPDSAITDLINQLDQLSDAYGNALKNIKGEAISVKATLTGVSGATAEHRETIKGATAAADKLVKAEKELAFAESENAKQLAMIKKAQNEANTLTKLQAKLNDSAAGSYNKLSAQYSINKIYLNNMSIEERESTEAGRELVTETNAIYQEMKRLQEETGKTSLNVGNYEAANVSLVKVLRQNTQELVRMKLAGEEGTAAYTKLLTETGKLKDEIADTKNEIKSMASDTSTLDSILGGASAAGGGFAVFTGAMELFGGASKDVEEAQRGLQAAIAITTGLQAVQNAVQKDSALMMGISKIQTASLAKAEAYRRLIQIQGTSATVGATVAQRLFNLVAAANPYVLLAMALITVVGALVAFSVSAESAAEKQAKLNEQQKVYLDTLQIESDRMMDVSSQRVKAIESELAVAKARGAKTSEIQKIEDELANARRQNHAKMVGFYAQEMDNLDKNKDKLYKYRQELARLQNSKATGESKVMVDLDLTGKLTKAKVDDAITAIQGKIDNLGRVVEIGVNLTTEKQELDAADAERAAERKKAAVDLAKEVYKLELDLLRKAQDAKIKLMANSYDQQKAQIQAQYARDITDLNYQLKTEKNLTAKGREAIRETEISLRTQMGIDLKEVDNKLAADKRAMQRSSQDIEIALMAEGADKQRAQANANFNRQIEDIQTRIDTERGLTIDQKKQLNNDIVNLQKEQTIAIAKINTDAEIAQLEKDKAATELKLETVMEGSQEEINLRIKLLQQQRAIELKQNAQLAADVRQSDADINAKYDALVLKETTNLETKRALTVFDAQQALAQSEFDLLRNSEERKTRFKLEAEKARLKKVLELNETAGVKMTQTEVDTIKNQIAKIDQEISKSKSDEKGKDIYGMLGLNLDDDAKKGISDSVDFAMGQLSSFMDSKVQLADIAVQASQKEVDANKSRLDSELEARANGYANNVVMAQKELDLSKKNLDKATKDKERAQKAQAAIETIAQTSSLITASAAIWASLSVIPIVGVGLALAALGVMWGSFAASKIKAAQVTKAQSQTFGDGTVELLQGGSHMSGNDVDLGTKPNGTRRRAEGGEYFAVINKRNSRRYRQFIPDIINSLNRGTFEKKYLNAYNTDGVAINVSNEYNDLSELENDVREIKRQNERRYYTNGKGETVEIYKNTKRTYKN